MIPLLHTSSKRQAEKVWMILGGKILPVRRTGEIRYQHDLFADTIRANNRRKDISPTVLSRINQLLKMQAANDDNYRLDNK